MSIIIIKNVSHPELGPLTPERDFTEITITHYALEHNIPLFAP